MRLIRISYRVFDRIRMGFNAGRSPLGANAHSAASISG
jgi:hypothetical protein